MANNNKSLPLRGSDMSGIERREKRQQELDKDYEAFRAIGRKEGAKRQDTSTMRGGILGTPAAYIERAGQYLGDKIDDADAYMSDKVGMEKRATGLRGYRQGLQDEGYKKGGKVKKVASGGKVGSASKRADGIAKKGKTRGKFV